MNRIHYLLLPIFLLTGFGGLFGQSDLGFHYQGVARDPDGALLAETAVNLRFQVRAGSPGGAIVFQEKHELTTNDYGLLMTTIGAGLVEVGAFSAIDWINEDFYMVVELNGAAVDTTHFQAVPYAKVATGMELADLRDVELAPPVASQVLGWNGTQWVPMNTDTSEVNELQQLVLTGDTLGLSQAGGSVDLSGYVSPWGVSGDNLFFGTSNFSTAKLQVRGTDGDLRLSDDQATLQFARTTDPANAPMIEMFPSGTNNSSRMLFAHSPPFRNWGLKYNDTLDAFTWIGNGFPALHIQLAGERRIGLGTDAPQAKLHVESNSSTGNGQLKLTELTVPEADFARITFSNDQNSDFWDLAARIGSDRASSYLHFFHPGAGNILSIAGSNRIGINKGNPAYLIDVENDGLSSRSLFIDHNNSVSGSSQYGILVDADNTAPSAGTSFGGYFTMTNDNGSSYGIRAISQSNSTQNAPSAFGVRATTTNNNGGGNVYGIYSAVGGTSSGIEYAGYFAGDVFSTGSYLPSDARLKKEIVPAGNALEKILALPVKSYSYDRQAYAHMNLPTGKRTGFLAQDLAEYTPELVKNSVQPQEEVLEDGKVKKVGRRVEFQAVDYAGLVPYLVKALQEQQEIIDRQKEEALFQEQRIQDLEERLRNYEMLEARLSELEAMVKNHN